MNVVLRKVEFFVEKRLVLVFNLSLSLSLVQKKKRVNSSTHRVVDEDVVLERDFLARVLPDRPGVAPCFFRVLDF